MLSGMDRHTVFTLALQLLGAQEYKEDSPTQHPCDVWFNPVLRTACVRFNWTFLARETVLKRRKDAAVAPGVALFPYPDGCLKITRMRTEDGADVRLPRLQAEGILVDEDECPETLRVNYQSDLVAPGGTLPDHAPEFCDAVVCLLASRVCMALTSNARLQQALEERAQMAFLSAIATDRQQDGSKAIDPITRITRQNIFRRRR